MASVGINDPLHPLWHAFNKLQKEVLGHCVLSILHSLSQSISRDIKRSVPLNLILHLLLNMLNGIEIRREGGLVDRVDTPLCKVLNSRLGFMGRSIVLYKGPILVNVKSYLTIDNRYNICLVYSLI